MKMRNIAILAVILSLEVVRPRGAVGAAPKAERWPFWEASNPHSLTVIDHHPLDQFLSRYLIAPHPSGIHRVRYADVTPTDRKQLKAYLASLQSVAVRRQNRAEQKAYWINLYNALTMDVILDHPKVKSIRDISDGLFSRGPWRKKRLLIEGEGVSLDDIEHRILRPLFADPRIHYAVHCASLGCPNLIPVAFTAENTDRLLSEAAHAYVNHPRGVTIQSGQVTVSSVYVWFQEDFGGNDAGVLAHLRQYADDALRVQLKDIHRIANHTYDWGLNRP